MREVRVMIGPDTPCRDERTLPRELESMRPCSPPPARPVYDISSLTWPPEDQARYAEQFAGLMRTALEAEKRYEEEQRRIQEEEERRRREERERQRLEEERLRREQEEERRMLEEQERLAAKREKIQKEKAEAQARLRWVQHQTELKKKAEAEEEARKRRLAQIEEEVKKAEAVKRERAKQKEEARIRRAEERRRIDKEDNTGVFMDAVARREQEKADALLDSTSEEDSESSEEDEPAETLEEMVSEANSVPQRFPKGTIILAPSNPMQVWAMKIMLATGLMRGAGHVENLQGRQYFTLADSPEKCGESSGKRKIREPAPEPEAKRTAVEEDLEMTSEPDVPAPEESGNRSQEGTSDSLGENNVMAVSGLSSSAASQLIDQIRAGVSKRKET